MDGKKYLEKNTKVEDYTISKEEQLSQRLSEKKMVRDLLLGIFRLRSQYE